MRPYYYTRVVNLTALQLCDNFCLVFQAWVVSCPQFAQWVHESLNLHHISSIHALLSLEIKPRKSLPKNFEEDSYKSNCNCCRYCMMSSHRHSQDGGNYGIPDVTPKVLHLTQFHFVWLKVMQVAVLCCGFWSFVNLVSSPPTLGLHSTHLWSINLNPSYLNTYKDIFLLIPNIPWSC